MKALTVAQIIEKLKECPQDKPLHTGGMFKREAFVGVTIDDDGAVCLLTKKEAVTDGGLRTRYGKMV